MDDKQRGSFIYIYMCLTLVEFMSVSALYFFRACQVIVIVSDSGHVFAAVFRAGCTSRVSEEEEDFRERPFAGKPAPEQNTIEASDKTIAIPRGSCFRQVMFCWRYVKRRDRCALQT